MTPQSPVTTDDEIRKAQRDASIQKQKEIQRQKELRRRNYHDIQVQGTNNLLIVSKRLVEQLYTPVVEPLLGEWFRYFVPKAKRRSPAINRGYWIRMEVIKRLVTQIVASNREKMIAVVNLGCGYDPLPFQLANRGVTTFYDLDYPDLIANKLAMEKVSAIQQVLSTQNYQAIGCDMNDLQNYENCLHQVIEEVVVFIAEVSLAYMKPRDADAVIKASAALRAKGKVVHFIVLEQIMPLGSDTVFSKKMTYHFDHLRHPLQLITKYSTRESEMNRFKQWFDSVELRDLYEVWRDFIDEETRAKVDSVEIFDEWEEFILFCHHYLVTHASTEGEQLYFPDLPELPTQLPHHGSTEWSTSRLVDLKFPAACFLDGKLVVNGGLGQSRSAITTVKGAPLSFPPDAAPAARMNHTLTSLSRTRAVLIGGRTRPKNNLSDVWVLNLEDTSWTELKPLPFSISRHSTVSLSPTKVLIASIEGLIVYDLVAEKSTLIKDLPRLASAALVYVPTRDILYLFGGMTEHLAPSVSSILYEINPKTLKASEIFHHPHLCRIGAQAVFVKNSLVVIGGINPLALVEDIVTFNIDTKQMVSRNLESLMLIGHQVLLDQDNIHIVGGGGVCYSFGNVFNPTFSVPTSKLSI